MMNLHIVCVDDQREVLFALQNDLSELPFAIETCESAEEAWEVLDELDGDGSHVALIICDQVMPDKNGVDFLAEVTADDRFVYTQKMLLTGLATHQDTIRAINETNVGLYVEKPWNGDDLIVQVRRLITLFVLNSRLDYQDWVSELDGEILYKFLHKRT